ncbi:AMP-binding protein [Nonomuraea sp. NPDC000554]|uniref:AMP-binding protein n=1 Tax=Nonomuraea sp. NPDC000554 TaxID=3154259 RepID=UPI00331BC732
MTVDTLAALLAARADDDRPGLLFEDLTWSWREYVATCRTAATWLDARARALERERVLAAPGVARFEAEGAGAEARADEGGGRLHVGVLCDNVPEMVFLLGGAALSGHVLVALNPTRSPDELTRDARATDVDLLLWADPYGATARRIAAALEVDAGPLPALEPGVSGAEGGARGSGSGASGTGHAAPSPGPPRGVPGDGRDPGELVMLIFTSGTSGRPRAVRVTQRKIALPGQSLSALLTHEDVVYCTMPLFHSGAIMAAYAPAVASGAALVLRRRFSASGLLPDLRRYGCTYLHYVGKALSYVLATPQRPDDARNPLRIAFGNEGSSTAIRRFGERFGCRVVDAFGSTETAVSITPDPAAPPGSLGRLPDGVEIRDPVTGGRCPPAVVEQGRLVNPDEAIGELVNVAGLGLFDGYYNDPDADAERIRYGAFWSGDLAYADADGYVFFAGRGTERLRVDGENLAVAPIESALREFPGVVEAAVYPVPDAAAGDQVMAALVLDTPFDPASFAAFLTSRTDLGPKAIPRFIRISSDLPQTPSHKVIKRLLAREAWRSPDPTWWRPAAAEFQRLDRAAVEAIEDEFVKHGRQHLLES